MFTTERDYGSCTGTNATSQVGIDEGTALGIGFVAGHFRESPLAKDRAVNRVDGADSSVRRSAGAG